MNWCFLLPCLLNLQHQISFLHTQMLWFSKQFTTQLKLYSVQKFTSNFKSSTIPSLKKGQYPGAHSSELALKEEEFTCSSKNQLSGLTPLLAFIFLLCFFYLFPVQSKSHIQMKKTQISNLSLPAALVRIGILWIYQDFRARISELNFLRIKEKLISARKKNPCYSTFPPTFPPGNAHITNKTSLYLPLVVFTVQWLHLNPNNENKCDLLFFGWAKSRSNNNILIQHSTCWKLIFLHLVPSCC